MKLIGLSGPVSVGKDTVADYLVETYGFTKFSFSDALYEEVAAAFGIDKAVLYKRETKETPLEALQFFYCRDEKFQIIMDQQIRLTGARFPLDVWCSPRQITQWWGTEYRRKQDPEYWIKKAEVMLLAYLALATEDPERPRAGMVNASTRFPNEAAFIKKWNGEVWHLRRPNWDVGVQDDAKKHVAERGLEPAPEDKVLSNNGTVEQLHTAASLLLQSQPGTTINAGPVQPTSELVTCVNCGWVHMAYTRAQAAQEVAEFNQWYEQQTDETKTHFGSRPSAVEHYEGCDRCGKRVFRGFQKGDCPDGCTIGPVIVE